jgi:DNA-binding NarL/FixJ family response regulator
MHIILADDQPKVRFAMRVLLERQSGMVVAGEVANADDLLAQLTTKCAELVLLSWELPGLLRIGSLSALRAMCPGMAVIALSGRPEACRTALAAGADAFVSKSDPPECLLAAIKSVSAGKPTVQPEDRSAL